MSFFFFNYTLAFALQPRKSTENFCRGSTKITKKKFIPYLKENTTPHNYKNQYVIVFKETVPVYTENRTKVINSNHEVSDCESRFYIQLLLDFKGLNND
jgi:sulfur transfer protein SufE